ncbi:MAG: mobile mystery protein B [Phycisphaerales bacterium]|nr:mobile mystery protein B [Phycisphaerales bacterium]
MKPFDYPMGATPLDPDELDGLKLKHITTRSELDRWEQQNIQDAIAWLKRKRSPDFLSEEFICELHEKMFGKVWKWAGQFRKTNKNIGVEWTLVSVELRLLLDDVRFWIENNTYEPDEIASRFHHRLVWVHLFPNGNGRHSRMMTDCILIGLLNSQPFSWGSGNLVEAGEIRKKYITALKLADTHDYSLLNDFVRS